MLSKYFFLSIVKGLQDQSTTLGLQSYKSKLSLPKMMTKCKNRSISRLISLNVYFI